LPYITRRILQIIKQYTTAAGIEKHAYPHLLRHQCITYLTRSGIISRNLQLLSGHATEQRLAVYRELVLSAVESEYEEAMKLFPVR
jgi:integrase/recombinase XerC